MSVQRIENLSRDVFEHVMAELAGRMTDSNRTRVATEVADAIASMLLTGQSNIRALQAYARFKGIEALSPNEHPLPGSEVGSSATLPL